MLKNKPIVIFITILIAVIIIAISVVVSVYNKNKPVVPDNSIGVVSSNDMVKIKNAYNTQDKKQEFLDLCNSLELAVANKLLDGTVTNDDELSSAIQKINEVLKTEDWTYLGIEAPTYWMGEWNVETNGAVTFTFSDEGLKPDWVQDTEIAKYIK